MIPSKIFLLAWALCASGVHGEGTFSSGSTSGQTFTIVNGQILTPGLAIVDSPQPNTPEGGDYLQVAIDISGDGRLPIPPYQSNAPTGFYNITAFLYSYDTSLNLTISNGTSTGWTDGSCDDQTDKNKTPNAGCTPIMLQEASSTVKHVNFVWPDCLAGDGGAAEGSMRGIYNVSLSGADYTLLMGHLTTRPFAVQISLHQSFRLNGTDHYTIFDMPISVTNSIPNTTSSGSNNNSNRPSCSALNNTLLSSSQTNSSQTPLTVQPWTGSGVYIEGTTAGAGSDSASTVTITALAGTSTPGISGPGQGTGLLPIVPLNSAPYAAAVPAVLACVAAGVATGAGLFLF